MRFEEVCNAITAAAAAARCNFRSRSPQKDVEGINSSVVSRYRAVAQRPLAPLSFSNPADRGPTARSRNRTGHVKRFSFALAG